MGGKGLAGGAGGAPAAGGLAELSLEGGVFGSAGACAGAGGAKTFLGGKV